MTALKEKHVSIDSVWIHVIVEPMLNVLSKTTGPSVLVLLDTLEILSSPVHLLDARAIMSVGTERCVLTENVSTLVLLKTPVEDLPNATHLNTGLTASVYLAMKVTHLLPVKS